MNQMMIDLWKSTAEAFDQRWQQIDDAKWDGSTPCDEYNVRQLVDHAVGVQAMVGGVVGAEIAEGSDWPTAQQAIAAALTGPEVLDGEIDHPAFGTMPKARVLGIGLSDLAVHTWDLSRAIGADDALPEPVVQAVYQGLQELPTEFMRAPGRFNDAVEVGADASLQDQMIAFSGRQP